MLRKRRRSTVMKWSSSIGKNRGCGDGLPADRLAVSPPRRGIGRGTPCSWHRGAAPQTGSPRDCRRPPRAAGRSLAPQNHLAAGGIVLSAPKSLVWQRFSRRVGGRFPQETSRIAAQPPRESDEPPPVSGAAGETAHEDRRSRL